MREIWVHQSRNGEEIHPQPLPLGIFLSLSLPNRLFIYGQHTKKQKKIFFSPSHMHFCIFRMPSEGSGRKREESNKSCQLLSMTDSDCVWWLAIWLGKREFTGECVWKWKNGNNPENYLPRVLLWKSKRAKGEERKEIVGNHQGWWVKKGLPLSGKESEMFQFCAVLDAPKERRKLMILDLTSGVIYLIWRLFISLFDVKYIGSH